MVRIITSLLFLTLWMSFIDAFSQDTGLAGLMRTQLTISPSHHLSDKQSHFYLHGNAEVFINKKISIAGEGYYYLGSLSSANSIFDFNHSLFFGSSYHFIKKNNDWYVSIQPGISITRLHAQESHVINPNTGINPVFSAVVGYNHYFHKIFHFFIQSRLVVGEHTYDVQSSLTEMRFSGGLGFHFQTNKR